MGRVSLTESYDDRSVIAKLNEMDKRVKENTTVVTAAEASAKASAAAAQETADRFAGSVGAVVQNANAQINASKAQVDQAKAEVDETVTTVAQAVQTANSASASAQQSANTVATYDTRLTDTETKNGQQDTAISELQTADAQNVKIGTAQYITGTKTFVVARTKNSLETKADVPPQQRQTQPVQVIDRNDEQVMFNQLLTNTDGTRQYRTNLFAVNGTRVVVENIFLNADGTGYSTCVNPSANAPSSATINKKYVESTDGVTNNLVHRTTNETINGYKQFEYSPSIKKICVNNNILETKWVRVCYYKQEDNFHDMHMITRFISGHTLNSDFMFTVDIKQRSTYQGKTLTLVDNASNIPLCINKAPDMGKNNCGLVALWVPHDNGSYIEIWGKLPTNRLCITVQNYVQISNLPSAEGVYMDSNSVGFDIATPYVTWDCNTFSDTLPSNATRTQYLQKGKEDVAT